MGWGSWITALGRHVRRFSRRDGATAGIEFALMLPAIVAMLMGTMDLGAALVLNRKVVSAVNTMADQASRYSELDPVALQEIERSGELILRPYPSATLGFDLISVQYDVDGNPTELCRVTEGMPADDRFPDTLVGLGSDRDGVVGLSALYLYEPSYWGFATGPFELNHFNVARSRTGRAIECS